MKISASAIQRYPGSGRLRFQRAQIAEQLKDIDTAITEYKKTIEIEDAYREQFRVMYGDREMFSRLGDEKYETAKRQIKTLSTKTP